MVQDFTKSLMERVIRLIRHQHKIGNYIYTLDEAEKADAQISSTCMTSSTFEVRHIKRCLGEAQAETLYESADAEVAGLKLTQTLKHAIFIDHLEQKSMDADRIRKTRRLGLKVVV